MDLKRIVEFANDTNTFENNNYVSIIAVEEIIKKRFADLINMIAECERHMSDLLGCKCNITINRGHKDLDIEFIYGLLNTSVYVDIYDNNHSTANGLGVSAISRKGIFSNPILNVFTTDTMFGDMYKKYQDFKKQYYPLLNGLKTNCGLFVDFALNDLPDIKMLICDKDTTNRESDENKANFWFRKNLSTSEKEITYRNDEARSILTEEILGKVYLKLRVDISSFPKDFQDEVADYELLRSAKLKEKEAEELDYFRKKQMERIMQAYEYFKKAIELLNNVRTDMKFERIRLEGINYILFKNNGRKTDKGYIEMEDFFKSNMVLRMLDLSDVDLSDVDIRGLDFSGTNIHINPQTIYNKDMTNVNCLDVKFNPWTDSFDDVILDGTIINDWEAMINLDKVKSYNESTKIEKNVVSTSKRI